MPRATLSPNLINSGKKFNTPSTVGTSTSIKRVHNIRLIANKPVQTPIISPPGPTTETIVRFTAVGTTTWTAPAGVTSVEYLVVGGGGGSGGSHDTGAAGGGGGGMVLSGTKTVSPGTVYNIEVGAGGDGGTASRLSGVVSETNGYSGVKSVFDNIEALGGGSGFRSREYNTGGRMKKGSAAINPSTSSIGGSGGGNNISSLGINYGAGAGGGGSSGDGQDGNPLNSSSPPRTGGAGGAGTSNSISGTATIYGRGGNGGTSNNTVNYAIPGQSNTGNGASGGGAPSSTTINGAMGGSGIVILKYTV